MNGVLEFIGGIAVIVVAGLVILAVGGLLRLLVRVFRLPSAKKYWWLGAAPAVACLLARLAGFHELADGLFILIMVYIIWFIGSTGIGVEDLDQEMFQKGDHDGGGDGGGA